MNDPTQSRPLTHHRLRVYWEAVAFVRLVHQHRIRDAELRDQASRAAKSSALNVAEASSGDGGNRRRHFDIARRSALETVSAYELAHAIGEEVPLEAVRRQGATVVAMLTGLIRR